MTLELGGWIVVGASGAIIFVLLLSLFTRGREGQKANKRQIRPGSAGEKTGTRKVSVQSSSNQSRATRSPPSDDKNSPTHHKPAPPVPRSEAESPAAPERCPMDWEDVPADLRKQLLKKIDNLSTLPTVVNKLVTALQDPDNDLKEIAKIASTDPAIATEILRQINSAYYGLQVRVNDLSRAILLMGYSRVRFLVMSFGMQESFSKGADNDYKKELTSIWRHSYLTSEAVTYLCKKYASNNQTEISTAALLHDLGKLLLLDLPPQEDLDTERIFRSETIMMEDRVLIEEEFYKVNHCLVGSKIADKLQLPELVGLVQSYHHHPLAGCEINELSDSVIRSIALVKLADVLSHDFIRNTASHSATTEASGQVMRSLSSYRKIFPGLPNYSELFKELKPKFKEAVNFLNIYMSTQLEEETETDQVSQVNEEEQIDDSTLQEDKTAPQQMVAGRYMLLKKLAEGVMGSVYLCEDNLLAQRFAIKILSFDNQQTSAAINLLAEEVRAAIKLNHPNIVRVFHLDWTSEACYLLQEYIDGWNLYQILQATPDGRMEEEEVLRLGLEMAKVLAYAHSNGVFHRDLNPDKVMMDRSGKTKILDFGITASKAIIGEEKWAPKKKMERPCYLSPEHWDNPESVDGRSDIYSFGVILYELLARISLNSEDFSEFRRAQYQKTPEPLPYISSSLMELTIRCLEPDPNQRWSDFDSLSKELEKISI